MQPPEPEKDRNDNDNESSSQHQGPLDVFISYAREDREWLTKLEDHLTSLRREAKITHWADKEIVAGTEWQEQIDTHLNGANVILLLVSPSFIASQYCWGNEVKKALERHRAGEAQVIPIILKPIDWQNTPLKKLQALPTGAVPVTQWADEDMALEDVARGIRRAIEKRSPLRKLVGKLTNFPAAFWKRREDQQGHKNGPLSRSLFLLGCLLLIGLCIYGALALASTPFPFWLGPLVLFLLLYCVILLLSEVIRPHISRSDGQRRVFLTLMAVTLGLFAGGSIIQRMRALSQLRIGWIKSRNIDQATYSPLENDLSSLLGSIPVPPAFIGESYANVIDALAQGHIEMGRLGPFSFLRAQKIYGVRAILRTLTDVSRKDTYRSYIITHPGANIDNLNALKGTGKRIKFALGDQNSTSGMLMPLYKLKQAGIDLNNDIETVYLGSHEAVINAVHAGTYLIGGVASSVYESMISENLLPAKYPSIIDKSVDIPVGPMVVRNDIQPYDELRIEDALLTVGEIDPAALSTLEIGGFAKVLLKDYEFLIDYANYVGISISSLE